MELAGLAKPEHLDGHSLLPLLKDIKAQRTEPALTAYQSHITVRTDNFRFIRYLDGTSELYDRDKDPHEWVNQTENPAYDEMKRELSRYLPAQVDMAPAMPRNK